MGLVFESHDEILKLTAVPVGLVEPRGEECGALIVNAMIVSNENKKIISTEPNIKIPLTEEWYKAIAAKEPGQDDRIIMTLSKAIPNNEVDQSLMEILAGTGNSLYEIDDVYVQPKNVLIMG